VNQPYVLTASLGGSDLTVTAEKLVWWGDPGPAALAFSRPVGLCSDNAGKPGSRNSLQICILRGWSSP